MKSNFRNIYNYIYKIHIIYKTRQSVNIFHSVAFMYETAHMSGKVCIKRLCDWPLYIWLKYFNIERHTTWQSIRISITTSYSPVSHFYPFHYTWNSVKTLAESHCIIIDEIREHPLNEFSNKGRNVQMSKVSDYCNYHFNNK